MYRLIVGLIVAASIMVCGMFFVQPQQSVQTFGSFSPTGGGTYRLQSSVGTSDSTITLSSFKEPVSNIPYTMSYLGSDIEYATVDPQTSKPEFVSFTGITQNSDGSATLTGVLRGLSRTPAGSTCTASTTLAQAHAAQSILILSNPPCLYAEYLPARTNATSSAILVFSSTTPPRLDSVAGQAGGSYIATTSEFASIAYVDAIAIAGVSNATESVKGTVELGTALETASSTSLGGTSASLVMQSKNATDTPQSGCAIGYISIPGAGCSTIANLAGKLRQSWLDLTAAFTFSGGLTSTGTTTISASSLTANPIVLDGIAYTFPSSRAASGTVLFENGSGTLTFQNPMTRPLDTNYAKNSSIVGTNIASTTAALITIPAGTLTDRTKVEFEFKGRHQPSGASCLVEIVLTNNSATSSLWVTSNSAANSFITGSLVATSTGEILSAALTTNKGSMSSQTSGYIETSFSTSSPIYLKYIHSLAGGVDGCYLDSYGARIVGI